MKPKWCYDTLVNQGIINYQGVIIIISLEYEHSDIVGVFLKFLCSVKGWFFYTIIVVDKKYDFHAADICKHIQFVSILILNTLQYFWYNIEAVF